ncbi:MAG: hypothetical protein ACREGR_04070, partial [Minisyncoccia bacterium]
MQPRARSIDQSEVDTVWNTAGTFAWRRRGALEAILQLPAAIARSPGVATAVLIFGTATLRLVFGYLIGLGVDESYMVSAGRKLQLSYFD